MEAASPAVRHEGVLAASISGANRPVRVAPPRCDPRTPAAAATAAAAAADEAGMAPALLSASGAADGGRRRRLVVESHLPAPAALPPVDEMAPQDIIRELVSVAAQREAETAAAIGAFEAAQRRARQHVAYYPLLPPSGGRGARAGDAVLAPAAEPAPVVGVVALTSTDAAVPLLPAPVRSESTAALDARRSEGLRVCARVDSEGASCGGGADGDAHVRLELRAHAALPHATLAYAVPRPGGLPANVPHAGPAPALDAIGAAKAALRAQLLRAPGGGSGAVGPVSAAAGPLFVARARVWPHAALTAAQSERRVQALLESLRSAMAYEPCPPPPPLAPTRLGSSHPPPPAAPSSDRGGPAAASGGSGDVFHGMLTVLAAADAAPLPGVVGWHTPSKSAAAAGAAALAAATPVVLTGASATGAQAAARAGPGAGAPGVSPTAAASITFRFATGVGAPPTTRAAGVGAVAPRTPGVGVRSPQPPPPAWAAAVASPPPPPARANGGSGGFFVPSPLTAPPRGVARFVDRSLDHTRPGVSPASFNRDHHRDALKALELGLTAMQAQRRAEEEHMRRATGVAPAKHPSGGYWYKDVGGGFEVSFHEYERLYLEEVAAATAYINVVTAQAWVDEAAAAAEEVAGWAAERRSDELRRAAHAADARMSWWDQDVDDDTTGLCAPADGAAAGMAAGDDGGATPVTAGAALLGVVRSWVAAEAQRAVAEATVAAQALLDTQAAGVSATPPVAAVSMPRTNGFASAADDDDDERSPLTSASEGPAEGPAALGPSRSGSGGADVPAAPVRTFSLSNDGDVVMAGDGGSAGADGVSHSEADDDGSGGGGGDDGGGAPTLTDVVNDAVAALGRESWSAGDGAVTAALGDSGGGGGSAFLFSGVAVQLLSAAPAAGGAAENSGSAATAALAAAPSAARPVAALMSAADIDAAIARGLLGLDDGDAEAEVPVVGDVGQECSLDWEVGAVAAGGAVTTLGVAGAAQPPAGGDDGVARSPCRRHASLPGDGDDELDWATPQALLSLRGGAAAAAAGAVAVAPPTDAGAPEVAALQQLFAARLVFDDDVAASAAPRGGSGPSDSQVAADAVGALPASAASPLPPRWAAPRAAASAIKAYPCALTARSVRTPSAVLGMSVQNATTPAIGGADDCGL